MGFLLSEDINTEARMAIKRPKTTASFVINGSLILYKLERRKSGIIIFLLFPTLELSK